jgi:hypothetical protein
VAGNGLDSLCFMSQVHDMSVRLMTTGRQPWYTSCQLNVFVQRIRSADNLHFTTVTRITLEINVQTVTLFAVWTPTFRDITPSLSVHLWIWAKRLDGMYLVVCWHS